MRELEDIKERVAEAKETLPMMGDGPARKWAVSYVADLDRAIAIAEELDRRLLDAEDGPAARTELEVALQERDQARADVLKLREALAHLAPFDEPVNEEPGDGHDIPTEGFHQTKCGCGGDSGPGTVYCSKHSPFEAGERALADTAHYEKLLDN